MRWFWFCVICVLAVRGGLALVDEIRVAWLTKEGDHDG